MPLHTVSRGAAGTIATATYASEVAARELPKRRIPEHGVTPQAAYSIVRDELLLDENSRQNLATYCTTWVSPEVRQLMEDSIDKKT
jgi:glutamate decarboxylase